MAETHYRFPVVPAIQPGETIHSAVLRLGRINGISESKGLLRILLPPETNLSEVSAIFNRSPQDLLRHHTLFPLINLFTDDERRSGERGTSVQVTSRILSRGDHTYLRFCPKCVRRDLRAHGYSYWRRAHQLPGVHYCWEHKLRLHDTHTSGYNLLPHEIALQGSFDECPTPIYGALEKRYNRLLEHILTVPTRLIASELVWLLRSRINIVGYSTLGNRIQDFDTNVKSIFNCIQRCNLVPNKFILITAAMYESLVDALSLISDLNIESPTKSTNYTYEHVLPRYYYCLGTWRSPRPFLEATAT